MSNEKYQLRDLERTEARIFKISQERIENMATKTDTEWGRPLEEGTQVYSNFDHQYKMTEEQVKVSGEYHQHAAYDFCGYVWFDPKNQQFIEEIHIYREIVNALYGETLETVIQKAIELYGSK